MTTFIDWEPLARAGAFGGIFLVALFGALWIWYDSSGRDAESAWTWRIVGALVAALTLPALVLGAANLDQDRETLLNAFAWTSVAAGVLACLTVVGYLTYGRSARPALPPPVAGGNDDFDVTTRRIEVMPPTQWEPVTAPVKSPPADAYFFVKAGPDKGKQFPLYETATIGRESKCSITLADRRVSGQHAQVKQAGGSYIFTDLSSTNGSYLVVAGRDEPIRSAQSLVDGDELRIGQTVLEFVDTRKSRRP